MSEAPLSVVIPTLDEAESLPATLAALAEGRRSGLVAEVVVMDGGSRDATTAVAAAHGARVVTAPRGRGQQLAAGAAAAGGGWLLFLHADTRPVPGWAAAVAEFMARPDSRELAAVFGFALDDPDPRARRVERLARWRGRTLALPYGDQGLLIARELYDRVGGYPRQALMEDVILLRRLGRRRLVTLEHEAVTSAERYRRDGWLARPLRNLALLALYFLGAPPALLRRLYG